MKSRDENKLNLKNLEEKYKDKLVELEKIDKAITANKDYLKLVEYIASKDPDPKDIPNQPLYKQSLQARSNTKTTLTADNKKHEESKAFVNKEINEIFIQIEKLKFDILKEDINSLLWDFDLNHQQQSIDERRTLFYLENLLLHPRSSKENICDIETATTRLEIGPKCSGSSILSKKLRDLIEKNTTPAPANIPADKNKAEEKIVASLPDVQNQDLDKQLYKKYENLLKNIGRICGCPNDQIFNITQRIHNEKSSEASSEEKSLTLPKKSSIRFAMRILEIISAHLTSRYNETPLSLENIQKTEQLIKVVYDRKIYNRNRTSALLLNLLAAALSISLIATTVALAGVSVPLFSALVAKALPVIKALWSGSVYAKTGAVLIPIALAASAGVGIYKSRIYTKRCEETAASTISGFFASSLKEVALTAKNVEQRNKTRASRSTGSIPI